MLFMITSPTSSSSSVPTPGKFKRRPSDHQKQMRFFTIASTVLVRVLFVAVILLLNRR